MSQEIAKSNLQLDYILLDCSSSMTDKWIESLAAIDAYVAGLNAEGLASRVLMHLFYSDNPDYLHRDVMSHNYHPMVGDQERPKPWGSTPLYAAVNYMGLRLRDLDPQRASIVIVTDGDDTDGGTTLEQAQAVLDWCRAKGWQVTFIGADFSNYKLAGLLGAEAGSAVGVQKKRLTDAASALAKKRAKYARTGDDMHFTEDEQQQFGGYLAPPRP